MEGMWGTAATFAAPLDSGSPFVSTVLRAASLGFPFFLSILRLPWLSMTILACGDGVDDRPSRFCQRSSLHSIHIDQRTSRRYDSTHIAGETKTMGETILNLTVQIMTVFVGNSTVRTDQLPTLIREVHRTLSAVEARPRPDGHSSVAPNPVARVSLSDSLSFSAGVGAIHR
jgi:hypothetical protein